MDRAPIRLLMAITAFRQEGPSNVFLNLIRAFDRNEITPILGVTDADDDQLAKLPPDVEVLRIGRPGAHYPIRSLAGAVRRSEADALLTTLRMNLTALAARPLVPRHVPIIVRQANHASSQVADLGGAGPLKKAAVGFAFERLGKHADVVIAQSRATAQDLGATWMRRRPDRVTLIPNPVDVDDVERRAGAGLPPGTVRGEPTFVAAGRLCHQKGFDVLLQALAELTGSVAGARLWLLGEGPDEADLRALATSLEIDERVDLLGFQREPFPFFSAADVYVSSSRYEGLPNAALEALACGTPVVATSGAGAGEELVVPGETGWLAEPGSVNSLAAALNRATAEARDLPTERIKHHVVATFGMPAVAQTYSDVVHQAVTGRRTPTETATHGSGG